MSEAAAWYQPAINVASTVGSAVCNGSVYVGTHIANGAVAVANFARNWFSTGLSFAAEHKEHVIIAVAALTIGAVITSLFFFCCARPAKPVDNGPLEAPTY